MLEMEIGDMLALVDILVDQGIVNRDGLAIANENKKIKLQQWSNLFKNE
jgi:hypothetical protein